MLPLDPGLVVTLGCHLFRGKTHSLFIWNMCLVVQFINYFKNMVLLRNLWFKIIPDRLSLGLPTYMEEIRFIGMWILPIISYVVGHMNLPVSIQKKRKKKRKKRIFLCFIYLQYVNLNLVFRNPEILIFYLIL